MLDNNTLIIFSNYDFGLMNLNDFTLSQYIKIPETSVIWGGYYIDKLVKNKSGVLTQTLLLLSAGIKSSFAQLNYKTNMFENFTEFYKPYG